MSSEILSFRNIENKIVYNPTIPFKHNGKEYISVRTESFDSELDSEICFAYRHSNHWMIDNSLPTFQLQDPALTTVKDNTLLSGVYVKKTRDGSLKLKTDFYLGPDISRLKKIASGPWGMKDIRIVEMDECIGVFTRPQKREYGKGKIGYLEICSLDELKGMSETDWYSAKILEGLFNKDEWGGVNQVVKLSEDKLGIIGHTAHQTGDDGELRKHYYAMSFVFNISTKTYSDYRIIAQRSDFPPSPSKRSPELDDILFPGGIDTSGYLYCGLSDYCVGRRKIKNPFEIL
ncbi:MAG: DUF1861 family protein [Nanoarchaeota archaeon]|nr:DUF1861 family protein [Nanoarchaeota archaeon]